MWSDTNLSPFIAITAHWIESVPTQTSNGTQHNLRLRADLIGFHRVPGRHTGQHLAQVFVHVLERVAILKNVSCLWHDFNDFLTC